MTYVIMCYQVTWVLNTETMKIGCGQLSLDREGQEVGVGGGGGQGKGGFKGQDEGKLTFSSSSQRVISK